MSLMLKQESLTWFATLYQWNVAVLTYYQMAIEWNESTFFGMNLYFLKLWFHNLCYIVKLQYEKSMS